MRLRQGSLEESQVDDGIARFHRQLRASGPMNSVTKGPLVSAFASLTNHIYTQKFAFACDDKRGGRPAAWKRVAREIPSQRLAFIALCVAFNFDSEMIPTWACVAGTVAESLDHDNTVRAIQAHNIERFGKTTDRVATFTPRQIKKIAMKAGVTYGIRLSPKDKHRLGLWLTTCVVEGTGLFTLVKQMRRKGKSPTSCFAPSQQLAEWMAEQINQIEYLNPLSQPMVAPPLRWEAEFRGGYYTLTQPFIKSKKVRSVGDADPTTLEAVNTLQDVALRISRPALIGAEEIWSSGRKSAGLPAADPAPVPDMPEDAHPDVIEEWRMKAARIHGENAKAAGHRLKAMSILSSARKFRDFGAVWFPYTVDFRSRIYPAPAPIQPQGDDVSKGMLEFAEGVRLGERGLYWLKVHLANSMGFDKASFDDRAAYADELIAPLISGEIRDWRGWEDGDKPFAALTAAYDLWQAYQLDDPADHVSHIAVAMDGSCNGMQHLSAMGRDRIAGAEVNLTNRSLPGDIYMLVADAVLLQVEKDMVSDPLAASWYSKMRDPRKRRKVVKRGVMTTPYGVTQRGMVDQLFMDGFTKDLPGDHSEKALASYMGKAIIKALGSQFGPGKAVMDWLQDASRIYMKETGEPMEWTAPLGFNAVQDYVKMKCDQIWCYTPEGKQQIAFYNPTSNKLDVKKGANGIVPNFVHSIDAAHMMAVILRLKDLGILDFIGVHDSYAVHAAHVDTLHEVIREEFVAIHEQNPLQAFKAQMETRLGIQLPDLPPTGTLDIQEVRKATYFFA